MKNMKNFTEYIKEGVIDFEHPQDLQYDTQPNVTVEEVVLKGHEVDDYTIDGLDGMDFGYVVIYSYKGYMWYIANHGVDSGKEGMEILTDMTKSL